ncbi:uncharacterized protein LOC123674279 isoform X2 [Harmonia axyridis]|uniref:uncharacterized protein LOC123674279 isoform X2 n=1 Tax=Harmonia axyridis TaxID=115357 RepID=UPI001E275F63|nr:uncharacterized protein LOC123674279 isoform X2 [Harmonia axyridis]
MNVEETLEHVAAWDGKYFVLFEQRSATCHLINSGYQSYRFLLFQKDPECIRRRTPEDNTIGHSSMELSVIGKHWLNVSVTTLWKPLHDNGADIFLMNSQSTFFNRSRKWDFRRL